MPTLFDQMEAGTLDPASFSHRDHVICACEALDRFEFFEATARYARGLKALTEKAGVPEKFNATVTFAFMSEIAERKQSDTGPTESFPDRHPELMRAETVLGRYPDAMLKTDLARRVALLPRA